MKSGFILSRMNNFIKKIMKKVMKNGFFFRNKDDNLYFVFAKQRIASGFSFFTILCK
jgi:hypothetical protein